MAPILAHWVAVKGKLDKRTILKEKYSKFINLIHARDFLAECLATFTLLVSIWYIEIAMLSVFVVEMVVVANSSSCNSSINYQVA